MEPDHAREDLHYIRQIMSQVSPPLSMSGWMGVGWGIVTLIVLGIMYMAGGLLAAGPFIDGSFLIFALFGGVGTLLWGLWVNRRLGG